MTNYITHADVEQALYLTAATSKQFSSDQTTAIENIITKIHGRIVEILGSEPTSTEGLKQIELEATLRQIWNSQNPEQPPIPIFTKDMIEALNSMRSADENEDSEETFYTATTF